MQDARDREGTRNSEAARDAAQPLLAVEFKILAGIDHVESSGPEHDCRSEPQNSRIKTAAHGDPGRSGSDSETEAQDQVREQSEALRERVEEQNRQRYRREHKAQEAELSRSPDE